MSSQNSTPIASDDLYLRLINRISSVVLTGWEIERILDEVTDVIREVLGVERVSILLINPITHRLGVTAARGIPKSEWDSISIPIGEGIAGRVAADGLPMISSDIAGTDLPKTGGRGYRDNSFASVPLTIKGQILGVLNLNDRRDGKPLDEADLQVVLAVATLVSLAIENSRLLTNAVTLQDHFRDVLSEMRLGVICTDEMASITLCNTAASQILGLPPTKTIGHELHSTLPKEMRTLFSRLIREAVESGPHAVSEIDIPNAKTGDDTPIRITVTALTEPERGVEGVVLVLEDLSLSREVEELRRLDELKSNFLSMVSHELRTPLTSIKGAIHLLGSGAFEDQPEQRKTMYSLLRKNTERLIIEINNILDVTQIEHRTLNLFPREMTLDKTLQQAFELVRHDFDEKKIACEMALDGAPKMEADHDRLVQVFRHLLDNAQKFTPEGGSVRVWFTPGKGSVTIHVRDSGIGIDPKISDKVFAKFFQLEHTLTRQAGGNGLGLFLAREITEMHGGSIRFVEVEGPGAEITVTLPLRHPTVSGDIANRETQ